MRKLLLSGILMSSVLFSNAQQILNNNFDTYINPSFANWTGNATASQNIVANGGNAATLQTTMQPRNGACISWGSSKGKPICLKYETVYVPTKQEIYQQINDIAIVPNTLSGDFTTSSNTQGFYGSITITGHYNGYTLGGTQNFNGATSGKINLTVTAVQSNCTTCPENFIKILISSCGNCSGGATAFNTIIPTLSVDNLEFVGINAISNTKPIFTNIQTAFVSETSTEISYTTTNATNATVLVKYGTSADNLNESVVGSTSKATLTNLTKNTTYYYQIVGTNDNGTNSSEVKYFSTNTNLITEYNFDNTLNNINGNTPFSSTGVSFVNDRNGNPNSALNINKTGSTAVITGLPYGNSPRTVAVWVKLNSFTAGGFNQIYSYGTSTTSQANGASISDVNAQHLGYANNHSTATTNDLNTWYHYVFVYDGTNSLIYKNGMLLNSTAKSWNTVNNSDNFRLGIGVGNEKDFDGAVDDLKIYNKALTPNEISILYSNVINEVSEITTQETMIYPNPAKNTLYSNESIAIYSSTGVLVAEGNGTIDISHLPQGLYFAQNKAGKTTKFIKE